MSEDRLFIRRGRRHQRKTYSLGEVRAGAVIVAGLAGITAWVAWRGAHPDPALFDASAGLLLGPPQRSSDRGPLPAGLAAAGWKEGAVAHYDPTNVYEKIDGREGYYKSFGFSALYAITLTTAADPAATVDIELYDLTNAANALGAYAGERPEEVQSRTDAGGLSHRTANALFLTRERFYARAIGGSDDQAVQAQLGHLERALGEHLGGEALPWAYRLFAEGLDLPASAVAYYPDNAFSFGFANHVYAATLADGETDLFVTATPSGDAAAALAAQFTEGFASYGTRLEGGLVKDRYIGSVAATTHVGPLVVGVRGAPDADTARAGLSRIESAVRGLPDAAVTEAQADRRRLEASANGGAYDEPKAAAEPTPVEPIRTTKPNLGEPTYDAEPAYDAEPTDAPAAPPEN